MRIEVDPDPPMVRVSIVGVAVFLGFMVLTNSACRSGSDVDESAEKTAFGGQVTTSGVGQVLPVEEIDRFNVAGLTSSEVSEFLSAIQRATASEGCEPLIELIEFPVTISLEENARKPGNAREFEPLCEQIVTDSLRRTVREERTSDLFANWSGVMIGRGEIWFAGVCRDETCSSYDIRIVAIGPWMGDSSKYFACKRAKQTSPKATFGVSRESGKRPTRRIRPVPADWPQAACIHAA